ncbi:MAG: GAD-like domain-containing protein [Pseudomonadota bacterium]
MNLDEEFEEFEEEFGQPTQRQEADMEALEPLREHMPGIFFSYWEKYGFSTFLNGFFQFINPLDFGPSLRLWLKGTEYEAKDDYFPFAMSFKGDLHVWGKRTGSDLSISLFQDAIIARKRNNAKGIAAGQGDKWASLALYMMPKDMDGIEGEFFSAGLKAHGALAPGEMYGLVPELPIGGEMSPTNLKKVSAPEYLAMVGELNEKPVLTTADLARRAFGPGADASIDKLI